MTFEIFEASSSPVCNLIINAADSTWLASGHAEITIDSDIFVAWLVHMPPIMPPIMPPMEKHTFESTLNQALSAENPERVIYFYFYLFYFY